jgi:hypothetical protein
LVHQKKVNLQIGLIRRRKSKAASSLPKVPIAKEGREELDHT